MDTKTILITGATAGIGRATALHLARKGQRVIATGRKREALAELAREAATQGARIETLVLDVTSATSIASAKAEVDALTSGQGPDVLVNNAGFGLAVAVDEISDADLRAQYETNVFGLVAMVRAFLPKMRERGQGRIINVSSAGGRVTLPLFGAYNSTKYAVESLSDAMRAELAPFGIDVVLIEPGPIRTEFASRSVTGSDAYHGRAESPYASIYARYRELAVRADKMAPGPDVIARAIERGALSRRPRPRYVAPFSTRLMLVLSAVLPTRTVDWLLRQVLHLTRRKLLTAPRPQLPQADSRAAVRS